MTSKLETLQEKLAKLQSSIALEESKEKEEQAIADIRDAFSDAITKAVAAVEKETKKSLREIGLGIWIAYAAGDTSAVSVSALAVGDDGLPKQLRRTTSSNGNGNGSHASNGNGATKEYVLEDGRVFESCLDAVHAKGIETHDSDGKPLAGKKWYHRHDRLPKELAATITVRDKAVEPVEPASESEPASEPEKELAVA